MPLIINLNKGKIDEVKMIGLYGNELNCFITPANELEVDISSCNAGIYFVYFFSKGKMVKSEKIIILD
jgi:hypothetical protein